MNRARPPRLPMRSVASPAQFVTVRLHLGKTAPKPRRSSATNSHGSTARVERAHDSVEVLSRGPKSAVEAQNEVASILRYRLG